jgi:hypothetical protein
MSSRYRWIIASELDGNVSLKPGCGRVSSSTAAMMDATRRDFRYNSTSRCRGLPAAAVVLPLKRHASEPMLETNPIHNLIKDLSERTDVLRGYL